MSAHRHHFGRGSRVGALVALVSLFGAAGLASAQEVDAIATAGGAELLVTWAGDVEPLTGRGRTAQSLAEVDPAPSASATDLSQPVIQLIDRRSAACGGAGQARMAQGAFSPCLGGDVTRGLSVGPGRAKTEFAEFEVNATLAWTASGPMSPHRLLSRNALRLGENNSVALVELDSAFLEGRVRLTSQVAWSQNWRAEPETLPRTPVRRDDRDGQARALRLDVRLLDSPDRVWTVTGEFSEASEHYAMRQGSASGRQLLLPGARTNLSSQFRVQSLRLTADVANLQSSFGAFQSQRVGVELDGVSLRLADRVRRRTAPSGAPRRGGRSPRPSHLTSMSPP